MWLWMNGSGATRKTRAGIDIPVGEHIAPDHRWAHRRYLGGADAAPRHFEKVCPAFASCRPIRTLPPFVRAGAATRELAVTVDSTPFRGSSVTGIAIVRSARLAQKGSRSARNL